MLDVVIALIPAMAASIFYFGADAVRLLAACVISSVAIEFICRKLMGRDAGVGDLSAVVTGIL
ncbi:Na+-transporting NADH:ubiquinone oxidoreductase subunit D, partial [Enterococcus hirae]